MVTRRRVGACHLQGRLFDEYEERCSAALRPRRLRRPCGACGGVEGCVRCARCGWCGCGCAAEREVLR